MPTRLSEEEMKKPPVMGRIVRVIGNKRFGFVRMRSSKTDYFFHADDYNGSWTELAEMPNSQFPEVECIVVESNKGPRVANVTPIWDDASNSTVTGF
jgi:cold shock CspA family protein